MGFSDVGSFGHRGFVHARKASHAAAEPPQTSKALVVCVVELIVKIKKGKNNAALIIFVAHSAGCRLQVDTLYIRVNTSTSLA